jgi:hypothetical protein
MRQRQDFDTKQRLATEFAQIDEERKNRNRSKSGGGDGEPLWWEQPRSQMDMFALAQFRQKYDIAQEFEQGPAMITRKRKKVQTEDQPAAFQEQLAIQAQQLVGLRFFDVIASCMMVFSSRFVLASGECASRTWNWLRWPKLRSARFGHLKRRSLLSLECSNRWTSLR